MKYLQIHNCCHYSFNDAIATLSIFKAVRLNLKNVLYDPLVHYQKVLKNEAIIKFAKHIIVQNLSYG
jgi:hypothetical protein